MFIKFLPETFPVYQPTPSHSICSSSSFQKQPLSISQLLNTADVHQVPPRNNPSRSAYSLSHNTFPTSPVHKSTQSPVHQPTPSYITCPSTYSFTQHLPINLLPHTTPDQWSINLFNHRASVHVKMFTLFHNFAQCIIFLEVGKVIFGSVIALKR